LTEKLAPGHGLLPVEKTRLKRILAARPDGVNCLFGKKEEVKKQEMLQAARLVAVGQGLGAVVTGSLSRRGDGYKLSVEALDTRTGNTIANAEINAATKDELLLAIPKLAAPIRKALGDTTPQSVQLAASGPFTAASLEVVHLDSVAMKQQFEGKTEEALQSFQQVSMCFAKLQPTEPRQRSAKVSLAVTCCAGYRN